jgi:tetratricopeptide (TPR) repeat protein
LSREEQRLFRRLAVFSGGCTLEAIAFLSQGTDNLARTPCDRTDELLEGVASLLDKSLVQQTEQEGEEPRLVLLETLRAFGLECLREQGELETARKKHAAYYLQFAEEAHTHLFGTQAMRWFELIEQEYDNLHTAFTWTLEQPGAGEERRVEIAARLGMALWRFWGVAHTLFGLASVATQRGAYKQAELLAEEALEVSRMPGDSWKTATAPVTLGYLSSMQGTHAKARQRLEESLALFRSLGYPGDLAWPLLYLAQDALDQIGQGMRHTGRCGTGAPSLRRKSDRSSRIRA